MKHVILFTMDGCPYCVEMKGLLDEQEIKYLERDINEYEDEYEQYVELTENEYVPAFLVIEDNEDESPVKITSLCPEDDFMELTEGIEKLKQIL
jgi:glutaredoxin